MREKKKKEILWTCLCYFPLVAFILIGYVSMIVFLPMFTFTMFSILALGAFVIWFLMWRERRKEA